MEFNGRFPRRAVRGVVPGKRNDLPLRCGLPHRSVGMLALGDIP
jgi:hypothetical protein